MSPEQTIALAVECGAETITEGVSGNDVKRNYVAYIMTADELHNMATSIAQQAIAEHLAKQQESAPVLPVVAYYGKGKDGCDSVNLKENKLLREFDAGEVVAEPLCKISDALAAIAAGGAK